jgi:hypothetical protein
MGPWGYRECLWHTLGTYINLRLMYTLCMQLLYIITALCQGSFASIGPAVADVLIM